jgi:hypothetical protein
MSVIKKSYDLEFKAESHHVLSRIAKSQNVPVEKVISMLIESSGAILIFDHLKKTKAPGVHEGILQAISDKIRKKPEKREDQEITIRVQDKIDKVFRDEDARLKNIKYAFCQNAKCTKPNKKYVDGTGVSLDYDGITLYFCSHRCEEVFLSQNG